VAAAGRLTIGQTMPGTVVRFDRGELVVSVDPGVEGRLPWTPSGADPSEGPPAAGSPLTVRVISFEPERERLGLALEQGQAEAVRS
jgi:ribosomal protein S1